MPGYNALLETAGPYRVDQEVEDGSVIDRIELRTDGNGAVGLYDIIYIYTPSSDDPYAAMPAHKVDFWRYLNN